MAKIEIDLGEIVEETETEITVKLKTVDLSIKTVTFKRGMFPALYAALKGEVLRSNLAALNQAQQAYEYHLRQIEEQAKLNKVKAYLHNRNGAPFIIEGNVTMEGLLENEGGAAYGVFDEVKFNGLYSVLNPLLGLRVRVSVEIIDPRIALVKED